MNPAVDRRMNGGDMHNRWIRYAMVIAGWVLLGGVLSIELYFTLRAGLKPGAVDFWEVAIPQFGRAAMWALMAPLILKMRDRVPLSHGRWWGGLAFHLAMSFVVMATYYLGRILAYRLLWEDEARQAFWPSALASFYGRNLIDMAYYWAVVAFGYTVEIYQRFRNEELRAAQLEARLVEIELKALRDQLGPHFLFNTLNTVAVLVREQKSDAAVALIARLSSLLRMALDPARTPEVTLRQEMDFLERYIEIQKVRFCDRLTVHIAIEPAALEARIPHLLLQPLVENAILHGIAPKAGPGRIEVLGRVEAGRLHLEVRDDGPGFSAGAPGAREGIGLSNTRERLEKTYGTQGQFRLRSEPGRGVSVQLILPCRP